MILNLKWMAFDRKLVLYQKKIISMSRIIVSMNKLFYHFVLIISYANYFIYNDI